MLSRGNVTFFLSSVVAALTLLSGCIIVDGTTNSSSGGGGSGGEGATGGSGGTGQGGAGVGGVGGGGVGGGGGSGGSGGSGGASCAGPNDGVLDINACGAMNITPIGDPGGTAALCMDPAGSYNPPGYDYCKYGSTIFTSGAFDVLQKCLAKIPGDPPKSCDPVLVSDCIGEASYAACPSQVAADTCDSIAKQCAALMPPEPFNSTKCQTDLNPLLDTTIAKLADVFNTNVQTHKCQAAYDGTMDVDGVDGAYVQVVLTMP